MEKLSTRHKIGRTLKAFQGPGHGVYPLSEVVSSRGQRQAQWHFSSRSKGSQDIEGRSFVVLYLVLGTAKDIKWLKNQP